MRPRRTVRSNNVFRLVGGTEDNDLWVERAIGDEGPEIRSTWVLTDDERQQIAEGANIELIVVGRGTPPVMMHTTNVQIGKAVAEEGAG